MSEKPQTAKANPRDDPCDGCSQPGAAVTTTMAITQGQYRIHLCFDCEAAIKNPRTGRLLAGRIALAVQNRPDRLMKRTAPQSPTEEDNVPTQQRGFSGQWLRMMGYLSQYIDPRR